MSPVERGEAEWAADVERMVERTRFQNEWEDEIAERLMQINGPWREAAVNGSRANLPRRAVGRLVEDANEGAANRLANRNVPKGGSVRTKKSRKQRRSLLKRKATKRRRN